MNRAVYAYTKQNKTKNKKTPAGHPLFLHIQTLSKGFKIDSGLNIVRFRRRAMENKLETDVQPEPKSIMKTFISKQNEVSRGLGLVGVDVTEARLVHRHRDEEHREKYKP